MLRIRGASKAFLGRGVLNRLNLTLDEGRVIGLVGPNGAGKTVLLKILAGIYSLDDGTIEVAGEPFRPLSPREARHLGVAYVPQIPFLPARATASELWTWLGDIVRDEDDTSGDQSLSPLARHHLEVRHALALQPRLMLIDEPHSLVFSSGQTLWEQIRAQCRELQSLVLFVSHDVRAAADWCDAFVILKDGQVGDVVEATEDPEGAAREVSRLGGAAERPTALGVESSGPAETLAESKGIRLRSSRLVCIDGAYCSVWSRFVDEVAADLTTQVGEGCSTMRADRPDRDFALDCTLEQNLSMPLLRGLSNASMLWRPRQRACRRVREAIDRCEVSPPRLDYRVADLSGGNKQRAAYARLMLSPARVILLVQPWRGLDSAGISMANHLIGVWLSIGAAVCVCTTDEEEAEFFGGAGDRYTALEDGRLQVVTPRGGGSE